MAKKTWRAPILTEDFVSGYDGSLRAAKGSLAHYPTDYQVYKDYKKVENTQMVEPFEFLEELQLDQCVHSGRSAKYVTWRSKDGKVFPMFVAELVSLTATGHVRKGGKLKGRFGIVKRGQNYGITYLGKD